jgi:hypothetical protein
LVGLRQADAFLRVRGTTIQAATRADLEAFMPTCSPVEHRRPP